MANFDFERCGAIVVAGQDGLVANVAKYAGEVPIIGVNPDPLQVDGILVPFPVEAARDTVERTLAGTSRIESVTLARVRLDDGQELLAFNDVFIGIRGHGSARYALELGTEGEVQSSSGMIIATGAGSTGWLSSVFHMAAGLARWGGQEPGPPPVLARGERRLFWVVREPFVSRSTQANMVVGELKEQDEMYVRSMMPEGGIIFSDGVEHDFIEFCSGSTASIRVADRVARLVVPRSPGPARRRTGKSGHRCHHASDS